MTVRSGEEIIRFKRGNDDSFEFFGSLFNNIDNNFSKEVV